NDDGIAGCIVIELDSVDNPVHHHDVSDALGETDAPAHEPLLQQTRHDPGVLIPRYRRIVYHLDIDLPDGAATLERFHRRLAHLVRDDQIWTSACGVRGERRIPE